MRQPLPQLKIPIIRYYFLHFSSDAPMAHQPIRHIFAGFAQTEYSQLILTELSFSKDAPKTNIQKIGRSGISLDQFETVANFTVKLDGHCHLEMSILEFHALPPNMFVADLSEDLIEAFEIIYLFYKGAIYPGIHRLDMMIDAGVIAMIPLREVLSRAVPDKLKINILAEYQLMNFEKDNSQPIDFNLIWFLGKMDLPSIDKFIQDEELRIRDYMDESEEPESQELDEQDPFLSAEADQEQEAPEEISEHDQTIKIELENDLRRFYLTEDLFFTRVVGVRHYDINLYDLNEGNRVLLIPEPDNPYDIYAVSVHTNDGRMMGYLKRELSELMYSEIQRGVLYRATVAKVLPEAVDSNSRIHLLIEKVMYHFN
ncbi:MAG: HIRAN domain-containing protein [Bacteroidetes bacterium]|nr:HIRAN domain-containing protein [Bacteroidota bacterium]